MGYYVRGDCAVARHHRIIVDYLIASGEQVFHIFSHNRIEQAHITTAARLGLAETLTYPADI